MKLRIKVSQRKAIKAIKKLFSTDTLRQKKPSCESWRLTQHDRGCTRPKPRGAVMHFCHTGRLVKMNGS